MLAYVLQAMESLKHGENLAGMPLTDGVSPQLGGEGVLGTKDGKWASCV